MMDQEFDGCDILHILRAVAELAGLGFCVSGFAGSVFDRICLWRRVYRPVDRDQSFLFPPDMREWLPADHPVWLVIRAVDEHMGTSAFHAGRKTGGAGTAGYDPDMLVTVLVRAYAHRVTSSREIERLCGTDVAFRVICAGTCLIM